MWLREKLEAISSATKEFMIKGKFELVFISRGAHPKLRASGKEGEKHSLLFLIIKKKMKIGNG